MAQWDKEPELVEKPSNPELNPLMNPTLGRNLGQWAQVYFTTPPEKRDEAVGELLRQLNGRGPDSSMGTQGGELPQQIACTTCGYTNPGFQKFCGMCGAALNPESHVETRGDRRNPLPSPIPSQGGNRDRELSQEESYRAETAAPQPTHDRDLSQRHYSDDRYSNDRGFGLRLNEPAAPPPVYGSADNDLDWLRSRDVLGTDVMETEPSRVWKVMIVLAALVLVGFAFMYARGRLASMRGQQAVVTSAPAATPSPAVSEPAQEPSLESRTEGPTPAAKKAAPAEAEPTDKNPPPQAEASKESEPAAAEPAERGRKPSAVASKPADQAEPSSAEPSNNDTEPAAGGGGEELQQAQRYLEGNGTSRNTGAAAQLLWKAVAKKNSEAVVLLADLYSRGDGVPKSCDQARLLLTTAVKKGTPGAASRLQSLSSTCQ